MVDSIELAAQKREVTGKKVRALRQTGLVPAVVYGNGIDPVSVAVGQRLLAKVFAAAGSNKMVQLSIDDARPVNVMIQAVQINSMSGQIIHADFYKVKMNEKIKAEIPLHVVGESVAVYKLEGSLIQSLSTVEVEALPANLPESIEVDISGIEDFDTSIHVKDLTIPSNVELLTDENELVIKVDPPRSDEEMEELDEPVGDAVTDEAAEGDQAPEADGAADDATEADSE